MGTSAPEAAAAGAAAPALLDVSDLTTTFVTPRGRLDAVAGVSLAVRPGEALGIVGESGSGKSVLVRTVMNLLPRGAEAGPSGAIRFDGRDVWRMSREELRRFWGGQVAMVFQDPTTSLNPVRRIGAQVADPLRRHLRMSRTPARERAVQLLTQVGISEPARRLRQYPHELSGGMRQRVAIAIALAGEPRLLIADEPTTALDVTVQKEILDLLAWLRHERRMAVILISHDLEVVAGRTDRTAVMYAGTVAEAGPTTSLFSRTRHPYTAALLGATPRMEEPSHTRLVTIPGAPPDLLSPPPGCRFAPRCHHARGTCLTTPPPENTAGPDHRFACFHPVGTPEGERALAANLAAGRTPAGLDLSADGPVPANAGTGGSAQDPAGPSGSRHPGEGSR